MAFAREPACRCVVRGWRPPRETAENGLKAELPGEQNQLCSEDFPYIKLLVLASHCRGCTANTETRARVLSVQQG